MFKGYIVWNKRSLGKKHVETSLRYDVLEYSFDTNTLFRSPIVKMAVAVYVAVCSCLVKIKVGMSGNTNKYNILMKGIDCYLTCLATADSFVVARPSTTTMERAVRLAVAGIGGCCYSYVWETVHVQMWCYLFSIHENFIISWKAQKVWFIYDGFSLI